MLLTDAHTHRIPPADSDTAALVNLLPGRKQRVSAGKIFFSCGIHPADIGRFSLHELRESLREVPCSAVGECGLDAFSPVPPEQQEKIFLAQIQLAEEMHLPMVIHCVRRYYDLIRIRRELLPEKPWLVHGFRGKPPVGEALLKAGCLLSLSPVWLLHQTEFPAWLPLDSFLLETDESGIALPVIYGHAARLSGRPADAIGDTLRRNFENFLSGDSSDAGFSR